MMPRLPVLFLAAALLCGPARAETGAPDSATSPVVVELFTSQGCSSCPPADAFLGELAGRGDVIALSFHVDYWNYIGWEDPFSSAAATQRQRAYGRALGLRVVYTPQMVIDGRWDAVGSNRGAVEKAIAAAARDAHVPVRFAGDAAGGYRVSLPETALAEPARLLLVLFDRAHETRVARGENTGRTLENRNVVRDIVDLGPWDGAATELPLDLRAQAAEGRDGCAVIVQQGDAGPVLGAAAMTIGN